MNENINKYITILNIDEDYTTDIRYTSYILNDKL